MNKVLYADCHQDFLTIKNGFVVLRLVVFD
ncbi:hypothetical protein AsAng_0045020 [Aureispira anguillae]|uniref:Uncharacterized protein n=1 Tax=Aureispira anguillae TaxID=2864201 RepID=A0A915YIM7_9BACT|nr:hypothetical protein AsAng_0045020 [Aureispira anguillae]